MAEVTMKDLLEAGVHFGHQTRRWNPKMKKFIFIERNGIYIIDLQKTLKCLDEAPRRDRARGAAAAATSCSSAPRSRPRPSITEEAARCGQFYVTERWLGGMLTNFKTIKMSIKRLKELDTHGRRRHVREALQEGSRRASSRERAKLEHALSGIKEMTALPTLVFIIDTKKEKIAVAEANRLGHPDRRHRRHELRPGRDPLPDPGQRRRDPRDPPVRAHGRRTRSSRASALEAATRQTVPSTATKPEREPAKSPRAAAKRPTPRRRPPIRHRPGPPARGPASRPAREEPCWRDHRRLR